MAWLSHVTGNPLLMAPFGATCVLLFSVPNSPLSQPTNVIGGHIVSTAIGLSLHMFLPVEWWSLALILIAWLFHRLPPRVVYPTPGRH